MELMAKKLEVGRLMIPVLIVGAGPYGLSLANYMSAMGQEFKIIGKPMELWKKHTFSDASLRSEMATSEIAHPQNAYSIQNFRSQNGLDIGKSSERINVREYRQYVDWVLAAIPYKIQPEYLSNLSQRGDCFQAELESGEVLKAKQVVIATGVAHHLNIPSEFSGARDIMHSYYTQEIEALQGKKVLVVGAGQSAAEAMEICRNNNNQVHWYARQEPRYYSEPLDLPKWIFNLVVKSAGLFRRLPHGLIQYLFSIFSATTMTPDHKVKLAGVNRFSTLPDLRNYDHVISATGYNYTLNHMNFLADELRSSLKMRAAMPRIDKNFMSSMRDLYFIGPSTEMFFGPPMKFMIGSQYVAPRLSKLLSE
ncbi:MAG: NAD(P)-binding domain-containing protein [Candidatus Marinimicrobia bacterium]|jgi:lysine/ornithine N-monooxygenase|nr:NAD(P)-binding domain-containing protein [Candidatus Neomarinimicrobiota bacterium]MBT3631933.1 NAD(P)-binding domain-containing protein [Candidatus Neomarinimicrobiota bacterium]MBT4131792.1 NAD(P)-binding domain-containing protein [Candidatus Neomarinimicrobiota bacterium]MBT5313022.1 NAD(P)-binding domain-containing protein [Candidatus Neomarinimicrobiota bacterium]MBT6759742.1 NAD(P)-binding domain-containing protein [Candidatus Neomarinimicrobiota bacterium]